MSGGRLPTAMRALVRRPIGLGNYVPDYLDTASGAKASRPQLDVLLKVLRRGDTLKITRLDRLGRSVLHLVTLGAELRERGVGLHVLESSAGTLVRGERPALTGSTLTVGVPAWLPVPARSPDEVGHR